MPLTLDEIEAVELPEGLWEDLQTPDKGQDQLLLEVATLLVNKRTEAVNGKLATGIEEIWDYCDDAYAGIDDLNRKQVTGAKIRWSKPTSMDGPLTNEDHHRETDDTRSTVFVPVSARYTDAAGAKVGEILLAPDDKAFSIEPTPVPDLLELLQNHAKLQSPEGIPYKRPANPDEVQALAGNSPASPQAPPALPGPPGGAGAPVPMPTAAGAAPVPGEPPMVDLEVADVAKELMDKATKKAEKAEKRIWDWMVEGKYSKKMRKVIHDAAKYGSGVLKGPMATVRKSKGVIVGADKKSIQLVIEEVIVPGFAYVSPRDFFPDANCGDDIQDGDYCFERTRLTERKLRDLKREPGYDQAAIDLVIKEGPGKINLLSEDKKRADERYDTRYEVWYYYGYLSKEELLCLAAAVKDESWTKGMKEDLASPNLEKLANVPVIATLVNDTVIRAVLAPLDSGAFPYHVVPWLPRENSPWGKGVCEQIQAAQAIINGATRALANNAGLSAGMQIVIDTLCVEPVDGSWKITPNKTWKKVNDDSTDDVKKAFEAYTFPNITTALLAVIEYGFRLCEESTNIPLITQGQSGKTTPQTLGATQIQDTNANQLLRSVGYRFDDYVTEPVVTQLYEWLLLDENVPNDEKGDYKINANGSTALVERHIQQQAIAGMSPLMGNPMFELDPAKWIDEYLRGNRLTPSRFKLSEEQKKKLAAMPPPKDPKVQAAELKAQIDKYKVDKDTDRDSAYVQAETDRTEKEYEVRLRELEAKTNLEMLKYANEHKLKLMDVKAELAGIAMKVQAQKELSAENAAREVLKPPSEPVGRAKKGDSYEA